MKNTLANQSGIAVVLVLIILIAAGIIGLAGYRVYTSHSVKSNFANGNNMPATSVPAFNQTFKLRVNDPITLKHENGTITFRINRLEEPPANHSESSCADLCTDMLPKIETELEYAGKVIKGTVAMLPSPVDMSFSENGAYDLIPYSFMIDNADYGKGVASITIKPLKLLIVEPGKQFTVHGDEIAALSGRKTGVKIYFGTCGFGANCMRNIYFYANDTLANGTFEADYRTVKPELQYASVDGSVIKGNGYNLRLVDSDDKTYATMVIEKN